MWTDTAATQRLGLRYPIVQGPFGGGLSSTRLAATVANGGGLGSFGAQHLTPAQIKETVAELRRQTDKPFAINLWVSDADGEPTLTQAAFERHLARFKPYYSELGIAPPPFPNSFGERYADQIGALLDARPPAFSFVFGIPSPEVLAECRQRAIVTIGTATTVDEAIALDEAGVDVIVATGFEAGGHRVSFLKRAEDCLVGTLALIPQVVDRVKAPVIAAGGIADGRGIAAALALGAAGVQIGTAFLACEESSASPGHREILFSPEARSTELTRVYTGRLARGIRNRLMDDLTPHVADLPPYPIQRWFAGTIRKAAVEQKRSDLISLMAGQAAPLLRHRHAGELLADLVSQTEAAIKRLAA